jgi:hypothetical protein
LSARLSAGIRSRAESLEVVGAPAQEEKSASAGPLQQSPLAEKRTTQHVTNSSGACTLQQQQPADFDIDPESWARGEERTAPTCDKCGDTGLDFLGIPCKESCEAGQQQQRAVAFQAVGASSQKALHGANPSEKDINKCSACGGNSTGMKADGTMLGTPCKVCCRVKLKNGHIGIAGSTEMPTVLEFEGLNERLFVWRYKKAWCVKKRRAVTPPDVSTAPRLLGNARIPVVDTNGEWTEPELKQWRGVPEFYQDACIKAGQPRCRARSPAQGKRSQPTFNEKTVEMGRKMQEPNAGWRPAGNDAAWGEAGPAWGSWSPPWGKQPLTRSISLPSLRYGPPGQAKRNKTVVKMKELGAKKADADKEFRFVARAMNEPTAKVEAPMSLECAMEARKHWGEWKNTKPKLPQAISDLIGYGDILFESPADDCSTMASTMSAPMASWEDSRSALRDDSRSMLRDDSRSNLRDDSRSNLRDDSLSFLHDSSCDTFHLPDISPKAKFARTASQTAATTAAPKAETRAAAEKRANRELVQASWKLQHKLSPVRVSIEHMFC